MRVREDGGRGGELKKKARMGGLREGRENRQFKEPMRKSGAANRRYVGAVSVSCRYLHLQEMYAYLLPTLIISLVVEQETHLQN